MSFFNIYLLFVLFKGNLRTFFLLLVLVLEYGFLPLYKDDKSIGFLSVWEIIKIKNEKSNNKSFFLEKQIKLF